MNAKKAIKTLTRPISRGDYKALVKQLNLFNFRTYKEFLDSDLWLQFRKRLLMKEHPCYICEKAVGNIPHHKDYTDLLSTHHICFLCPDCHRNVHQDIDAREGEVDVRIVTDQKRKDWLVNTAEKLHANNSGQPTGKRSRRVYIINKETCWCSISAYNGKLGLDETDIHKFLSGWKARTASRKYLTCYEDNKEELECRLSNLLRRKVNRDGAFGQSP